MGLREERGPELGQMNKVGPDLESTVGRPTISLACILNSKPIQERTQSLGNLLSGGKKQKGRSPSFIVSTIDARERGDFTQLGLRHDFPIGRLLNHERFVATEY